MRFEKRVYEVQLRVEVPEGTPTSELRSYIKDALASWGGQFHPDEFLYDGVSVRSAKFKCGPVRFRRRLHA